MNIITGSKYFNFLKFTVRKFKRSLSKKRRIDFFNPDSDIQPTGINKIFAINLDRQRSRWKTLTRELLAQKVINGKTLFDFLERIPAVDGRTIKAESFSSNEVDSLYNLKEHFFIDPDPRLSHLVQSKDIKIAMSSPELAVALSHIQVWNEIVNREIPYSLILEDDIFFEDNFSVVTRNAWSELPHDVNGKKSFDLLYLSFKEVDNRAEKQFFSTNIFKPIRGFWWLSGYILTCQGAQKLLDSLPIRGPVDMWMNLQFQSLDVFSTSTSVISQRGDFSSDNSYSIMPILSRAGIHLEEKGQISKKLIARKPVFAIGLNKTGTTSLHFALTLLGYKCCHWISEKFSSETSDMIDRNANLPFDAYTDVECITSRFKELDSQYPDAAFILTTRDIDEWIASRSRHVIRNRIENANGASHNWTVIDVESWKQERAEHHNEVMAYFENRENKLLVLDVCGGEEWGPLCEFLKLPIPNAAFPHVDPLIKLKQLSRSLMNRIPISGRNSVPREHDDYPWIKRPENILNYIGSAEKIDGFGSRTGSFSPEMTDNFNAVSPLRWELLNGSFPYNLVKFDPRNVEEKKGGGLSLILRDQKVENRDLTSGSLRSVTRFQYGRFEIEIKPVKADGLISAFFLYRIDPWQEIDIEFLGNDTTKMLLNVYFNPGEEGTVQNFGTSGTPVIIDLGFDASTDFHHYAIEWDPNEIRWFVDDDLVHVRTTGYPTPIPNLPLQVYMNLWAPGNSALAGQINTLNLPKETEIRSVVLSSWFDSETIETVTPN